MGHHKCRCEKPEFCHLKAKSIRAKDIKACQIKSQKVTASTVKSQTVTTNNLITDLINGVDIRCVDRARNVRALFDFVDYVDGNPVQPPNPGFDERVWDDLWNSTLEQYYGPPGCPQLGLAGRLHCGRMTERYHQNQNGCVPCPDEFPGCQPSVPPTGDQCNTCFDLEVCPVCSGSTGCQPIPGRILGFATYPTSVFTECGNINLLSEINFDLNVFNESNKLGTRVVSVLVQVGSISGTGEESVSIVKFSNKQFQFTLDNLYGDNFAATVHLPEDLITSADRRNGAVQVVIYIEQGTAVQILPDTGSRSQQTLTKQVQSRQIQQPTNAIVAVYDNVSNVNSLTNPFVINEGGLMVALNNGIDLVNGISPVGELYSVNIYTAIGSGGPWLLQQTLNTEVYKMGTFGRDLAISGDGDTVAITGLLETGFLNTLVYTRTNNVWSRQASLIGSQQAFARGPNTPSVTLSHYGNTMAVGSPDTGEVRIYVRNNGIWTQQGPTLNFKIAGPSIKSVSLVADLFNPEIDGGMLAIGSLDNAVYIYTRSGTTWSRSFTIPVIGYDVSLTYNMLAIVQFGDNRPAYVFRKDGNIWVQIWSQNYTGAGYVSLNFASSKMIISSINNVGTPIFDVYQNRDLDNGLWIQYSSNSITNPPGATLAPVSISYAIAVGVSVNLEGNSVLMYPF